MQPFRINYAEREIEDLNRRLDATRWPHIPFETRWSSGTNDRVLRDLVGYWRHEYDWFEVQERSPSDVLMRNHPFLNLT